MKGSENLKQLIEVIKLVVDKYAEDVNLIISNNYLTLEYLTNVAGDQDAFEVIKIEEFDDKLKVSLYNDKIEKIIDIEELENIILILEKQSKAHKFDKVEIEYIREKYKPKTQIELIREYDLKNEVPPHTRGTIDHVADNGAIFVNWNNGTTSTLMVGTDEFKILNEGIKTN